MLNEFISILVGIIVLFPFIVTIVFLVMMRKMGKAPSSMIGKAADWTTPFLFISVYVTSKAVFGMGTGFYIAGITILVAFAFATAEKMKEKEFRISRFVQKTWRFYFLVLALSYVLLLLTGIILKILEYVE